MHKALVVVRGKDRDRLLECLRGLGVVHLVPVDPARAVADGKTLTRMQDIGRAVNVLSRITPAGEPPDAQMAKAPHTVLDVQRRAAERRTRLIALNRDLVRMEIWGNVELEQFDRLRQVGIDVQFYMVPDAQVSRIEAECVHPIRSLPGRRSLVAVIDRRAEPQLPEGATHVPLPQQDAPSIRAEAAAIGAALEEDAAMLGRLAHLTRHMEAERLRLQQEADYTVALRGSSGTEDLLGVQGWIPAQRSDSLEAGLARAGIHAAVRLSEPGEDEQPPTQIRYPAWIRPIKGLFDLLGTVAGYREFDLSTPFMIALPIFAAMLISDGGYGAVLLFVPLLGYRKIAPMLGTQFTRLLMIVGAVAMVWGLLCASFFGCLLYTPPIPVNVSGQSRELLMRISFVMGAIHLSIAQLWQAVALYPNLRFLNKVGWAVFLWGMLGVVMMYVLNAEMTWQTPWPYCLIGGAALTILFCQPGRNVFKSIGLGLADFPLSLVSSFSDVISYVRLMAVGLASSVLAATFNGMAMDVGHWALAVVILIFGHGLTLGLALIALFAHGVRLNMLEFSNNLGMRWTGYAYAPFRARISQESRL
jgi:V/A-type H+-transporting ATPase subunit I